MTGPRPPESRAFRNPGHQDVAFPLSFPATTTLVQVVAGDVVVAWWSFTETTGAAPASLTVYDGADTTGQELATINLPAGGSVRDQLGPRGLFCTRALSVAVTSGSVRGTLAVINV